MGTKRIFVLFTVLALVLAACSGGDDDATPEATIPDAASEETVVEPQIDAVETADTVVVEPAEVEAEEPVVEAPAPSEPAVEEEIMAPAVDLPAWMTTQLVDARTGEIFTLADFEGKTVFVEPMATWCTNCRGQLGRVAQARFDLDPEQHVFIALSLETGLSNERLANYADSLGFDWTFAVITPTLLGDLVDEFGRSIGSAPNTPHFVIRPDQTFTDLSTGSKQPDQIVQEMLAESEV